MLVAEERLSSSLSLLRGISGRSHHLTSYDTPNTKETRGEFDYSHIRPITLTVFSGMESLLPTGIEFSEIRMRG